MAKISGMYIIIDELQGAFKIKSAYKNCPELSNALSTYQGIVLIIKNGYNMDEQIIKKPSNLSSDPKLQKDDQFLIPIINH
uniref:Uncharacterized protein n=1 Tax=Romanomermis culicivorax TaxID=13658 RepID=A0A915JS81_ROMCU